MSYNVNFNTTLSRDFLEAKLISTVDTSFRFAILDRSSTRNERRDRGVCDLISRCRGTMVPASASARRNTPASRNPALGGHEGRGRWRWSPIGRTVRNRVRSYRRRGCHPTHRPRPPPRPPPPPRTPPRRGETSVGEFMARLRPVSDICPPCSRGSVEAERVGNAYRGTISHKISRWFTIRGEP